MTRPGEPDAGLAEALRAVRATLAEADFPLPAAGAPAATARAAAIAAQLDDYLLPRLGNPHAPLLVAVGGSTGAGKSTLVNSLVQAPVSPAGVLRPTTRVPVLVCHPSDAPWFRGGTLLGGPAGPTGRGGEDRPAAAPPTVQLVAAPGLPRGVAFLDTPDIDSLVDTNRTSAQRLLAAADLWLFVITANRYADALPWQLLRSARDRGAVIALVLSRVSAAATDEVVELLTGMLREQRLVELPVFVMPETRVLRQGLLPETATQPLRHWFESLAGDEPARARVAGYTLDGALAALPPELAALASAADEQALAGELLAEHVGMAYGLARGAVERALSDGEVDLLPDAPASGRHRQTAAEAVLVQLVLSAAADAADQTDTAWRSHPAGAGLLGPEPVAPAPDLARQVQRVARAQPREEWPARIGELLDQEAARWLERLPARAFHSGPGPRLRELAGELEAARLAAGLTRPDELAPSTGPERAAPAAATTGSGQ